MVILREPVRMTIVPAANRTILCNPETCSVGMEMIFAAIFFFDCNVDRGPFSMTQGKGFCKGLSFGEFHSLHSQRLGCELTQCVPLRPFMSHGGQLRIGRAQRVAFLRVDRIRTANLQTHEYSAALIRGVSLEGIWWRLRRRMESK